MFSSMLMAYHFNVKKILILGLLLLLILIGFAWGFQAFNHKSSQKFTVYKQEDDRALDSLLFYDYDLAVGQIDHLFSTAKREGNSSLLARAYYYKMAIGIKKYRLDSLPIYYEHIIDYSNRYRDKYLEARANLLLGVYYSSINDTPKSLELFLKAESYFRRHQDLYNLANANNNLGGIYYSMGELDKAMGLYEQSEHYFKSQKNFLRAQMVSTNKAGIYLKRGEINKAKDKLGLALEKFEERHDTINVIRVLSVLSYAALEQKNTDQALLYLDRASFLAQSTKDTIFQSLSLTHYGNIYNSLRDYDKAIDFYRRGFDLSVNKAMNVERLRDLSNVFKKTGRHDEALNYLDRYYHLKDSINGTAIRLKLQEVGWNNILEETQLKHKIEGDKQDRINFIYLISIVFIVVIATMVWLLYRNNKKRLRISTLENIQLEEKVSAEKQLLKVMQQQHETELKSKTELQQLQVQLHEIETKSREFENKAQGELQSLQQKQHRMEIASKNRELAAVNIQLVSKSKLVNKIEKLIQDIPDKKAVVYKALRDSIKESRSENKDWEQFKELFQNIHPDFFKTLQLNYPELTKTEMRICAYIKINMDNSSISHLLNISHQSLMTNRYKIRKRLNLTHRADDLDAFIQSL